MKERLIKSMESFSKAMVQPVLYLSITGLVIILGVILTNQTITNAVPFLQWAPFQIIGGLIYASMMAIIQNLAVIFAVGIAAALAKSDKHHAAFISLMCYIMYITSMNTFLSMTQKLVSSEALSGSGQTMAMGLQVLDTGVFAGMIIGCLVGYIFNKTCNKEFKGALQLYSGARFSLLVLIPTILLFSVVMCFIWPSVQGVIAKATGFIANSGAIGIFTYGFLDRLLIPTGLHHLVYTPFLFSELGGVVEVGGQVYAGAAQIAMMEMNNPEIVKFSQTIIYNCVALTKYFGLLGAAFAIYKTAKPENKKRVKAIMLPAAITALLAGITEPLEFAFLFAAPGLFLTHSILAGLGLVGLYVLKVTPILSGGIINTMIMNLLMGVEKTNWPMMIVVGVVQCIAYYFIFKFLIEKFDMKTPGREKVKSETAEIKLVDVSERTATLINGLGGKGNIVNVENCFTRLRVEVKDISLVDDDLINQVQNSGIVKKGNNIQIIFGLQVQTVRKSIDKYLIAMA